MKWTNWHTSRGGGRAKVIDCEVSSWGVRDVNGPCISLTIVDDERRFANLEMSHAEAIKLRDRLFECIHKYEGWQKKWTGAKVGTSMGEGPWQDK